MKISKEALRKIIKEEVESAAQQKQGDVERMLQFIDKIDNYREYGELLRKVLLHDVKGKELVMKRLLGPQLATAIIKKLEQ